MRRRFSDFSYIIWSKSNADTIFRKTFSTLVPLRRRWTTLYIHVPTHFFWTRIMYKVHTDAHRVVVKITIHNIISAIAIECHCSMRDCVFRFGVVYRWYYNFIIIKNCLNRWLYSYYIRVINRHFFNATSLFGFFRILFDYWNDCVSVYAIFSQFFPLTYCAAIVLGAAHFLQAMYRCAE